MMKRGVITRTRPAVGAHPAPGDILFFAPPLVITEAEIDRLVGVARDAVEVVLARHASGTAPPSPDRPCRRRPFRPTGRSEAAALSDFLGRMFPAAGTRRSWPSSTSPGSTGQRSARTGPGSRSFTARHDGAIVAHAAAWPVRVCVAGRVVPAAHLIDWAADPKYPGAGIWLLRQIGAKVP